MTTFAEIIAEVKDKVRDTYITIQIKRDVNNIIRWILRKRVWSWQFNYVEFPLTANQETYNLPDNCEKVAHFSSEYGKLGYIAPNDWLDAKASLPTTSTPSYYTQMSPNTVTFYPTPSDDISLWLRYVKTPVFLVNNEDELSLVMPDKYKDIVVYGTCLLIARTQNDVGAEKLYASLFNGGLQDMLVDDEPLLEEGVNLGSSNTPTNTLSFPVGSYETP